MRFCSCVSLTVVCVALLTLLVFLIEVLYFCEYSVLNFYFICFSSLLSAVTGGEAKSTQGEHLDIAGI